MTLCRHDGDALRGILDGPPQFDHTKALLVCARCGETMPCWLKPREMAK